MEKKKGLRNKIATQIVTQHEEICSRGRLPEMVKYWEEQFPGKGGAIADMLLPFFVPIEPRPALPNLRERASRAVFWHEVQSTRIFTLAEGSALNDALDQTLNPSLWSAFGDAVERAIGDDAMENLTVTLAASGLPEDLRDLDSWLHARDRNRLFRALTESFGSVIGFAASFLYADMQEELSKLHALLEIVKAGNFPIGFDVEGNLLVLVA
ncbi:MAG: hypothetical protein AAB668_01565 [Patescibacteria group bacterium]